MNIRFLLIVFYMIINFQLSAQDDYYIEFGVQNHFALNKGQNLDYFNSFTPFHTGYNPHGFGSGIDLFTIFNHEKESDYSLSKGVSFNLSGVKKVSELINLKARIQYFTNYNYNRDLDDRRSFSWGVNSLNFIPQISIKKHFTSIDLNVYGGLLIGLTQIKHKQVFDDEIYRDYATGRSLSYGYVFGINSSYDLKEHTALFISMGIQSQFYTPNTGYLRYSQLAENYDLETDQYYINYTKEEFFPARGYDQYNNDYYANPDNEYQYNIPVETLVLNSVTLEIGIRFSINSDSDE